VGDGYGRGEVEESDAALYFILLFCFGISGSLALGCEDEEEEVKGGGGGCKITCRARAAK